MDEAALRSALGGRLKGLRQLQGLTQVALAEAAGMDQGHLARIERGERWPSVPAVYRLASALGVRAGDVLADRDPPRSRAADDVARRLRSCSEAQLRLVGDVLSSLQAHWPH